MSNVLTFTPRPRPAAPAPVPPLAGSDLRARLEEAAQTALDAADKIIAALDRVDGDADFEPDADAEPSLAAPEGHDLQVGWARGGDQDREADAPEAALPVIIASEVALPVLDVDPLPPTRWNGAGNIVSAAGCAFLSLVGA